MKKLLLIFLLLPLFASPAYAEGLPDLGAVREELPEEALTITGELRGDGYDGVGALERLWDRFLERVRDNLREAGREALKIFSLCALCALGCALTQGKQSEYIQIAGCALLSGLIAGGVGSLTAQALEALQTMCDYAGAALPALYTAAAACGAPVSAPAGYALSCLALDALMTASRALIVPLLDMYLAMAVCGSIFDNALLRSGVQLSKKLATLLMTGMTAAFTALLALSGLVSGQADAVAVKGVKTLISVAVPVVGKMLSDAASSAVSAGALVKNSAGAFGLTAVCALCVAPFAALAVRRLLFSLAAAAAETAAGPRLSRLLGDLSGLMGLLLGLVGSFALMLFFSIAAAMRAVSG